MLAEWVLVAAMHHVPGGAVLIADKVPYETAEESAHLYTRTEAQTVEGIILDTRTVELMDGEKFMQIDVKTGPIVIRVHLGPAWYMEEYDDRFDTNRGRSVSIVGSVATIAGTEVLVASEVSNGDRTQRMRLRHPDGTPAWVGGEHAQLGAKTEESLPLSK